MNRSVLNRSLTAVAALAAGVLAFAVAVSASAVPSPFVTVTSPSFDAPGGTVMTVVTITNVPARYTITSLSDRTFPTTGGTSCDPFRWSHGASVSQKCYTTLPTRAGSWTLRATATLTRVGATPRVYAGYKTIKTVGPVTGGVSAAVRQRVAKCYNTSKNVWLTFDDGYTTQANLGSILGTLKAYHVRAHFMLIGSWARTHASMVNQITSSGQDVENHTNTHPALSSISNASVDHEIRYGQPANTTPRLLRPPYGAGAYTSRLYFLANHQRYRLCGWEVDTRDWSGVSAATIVSKVLHGDSLTAPARAGDPVLMHLTNTQSRYALPTLIRLLRAKGLTFEPLR